MDEEIRKVITKNLELTEEIHAMTKKINSYIVFKKVMGFIYFFLIIVPLIIGLIYLPPLLKDLINTYQGLLGGQNNGDAINKVLQGVTGDNLDLKSLNLKNLAPAKK